MSIRAECLRTARACTNQNSFSNSINPLAKKEQKVKKSRIANILLRLFNKHQSDLNYVTKTGKELLAII